MKTIPIVIAIVMSTAAHSSVAEAQAGQANPPASVASQAAKKAWVARAIDDILSGPVEAANHTTIRQGRSASRRSMH